MYFAQAIWVDDDETEATITPVTCVDREVLTLRRLESSKRNHFDLVVLSAGCSSSIGIN